MHSRHVPLATRIATVLSAMTVVAIAVAGQSVAASCKPSPATAHLTHLEVLLVQHDLRHALLQEFAR
jgi:hypothetical protein